LCASQLTEDQRVLDQANY